MRDDRDVSFILERKVPSRRGTKAVPGRADPSHTGRFQGLDDFVEHRHPRFGAMRGYPLLLVETGCAENESGVAVEDVGHDGLEAAPGKVVDEKLWIGSQWTVRIWTHKM